MTEADLDSEDLATSITLTELTDGLLEPAAEMSVETQDEADFSDLEALLDLEDSEDPEDPATSEPRADTDNDDFDDLEALLDDSAAEASPNTAVGQPLTEMTASDADDFSDLEALLDVEAEVSAPALATPETLSTADFEENSNEFEDLERLLEEADQTLGGGTSASSRSTPQRSRRPARRGGSVLGDQTMRVSVNHLDNLSNLVGELVVNRNTLEQDQERLRQFLDNLMSQVQQLNDVGQRIRDLYERSLLESSLISSRQSYQMSGNRRSEDKSSHSTGATFDALEMDRFTGFHTLSQEMIELIVRVRESASDIGYTIESSDQVTRQFRQVTTQLQEGLNKARMVPFAQTADRLPRAVRDISVKCGKEARLVVEGRDTLIDKMILEQLYDPMTHLVNNAITHGVELPEVRSAQGKPPEGQITVRAFYQGNQTVIYVADDGAGIDAELVKKKAVQKGLILPAEAGHLSIHDVYELLFHPGFSTRDQADDFAGRGVGMDVVRTYLSQIRGNITIDSEIGKGTSFTIRLPLTLSISKALTCISNQARIAFPMDGVEDMLDIPKERVQENDQGQTCIFWRDTLLPFQPLSDLLQFNRTLGRGRIYGGNQDDEVISIVILRSATTHIALQVDQVIGEQEIVIKQLEGPVPKPMGIAGATVLGDGRVMPIADVLELIDLSMGRVRREPNASLWGQLDETTRNVAAEPPKTEPTVLIVDDSITVRELLSMSFNKVGYRVEQARDGQEAWEKLRSGLPCDLVFCDIEMPRMDGLELLSRMQKDPSLSEIPIAMLTSRGADRHRQMAVDLGASGYFTKPYLEEVLLDAAQRMLNGETFAGGRSDTVST
ncbi:MAG: hybrid sensor histidine kinase/response regulator [Leptolyngbyaceae cyanobacterium RM1_1_2]|nr:hybrid sensor histidine kinase/response regulator [Leptolyngbyaceae cyanobacterium RM1_1_2]